MFPRCARVCIRVPIRLRFGLRFGLRIKVRVRLWVTFRVILAACRDQKNALDDQFRRCKCSSEKIKAMLTINFKIISKRKDILHFISLLVSVVGVHISCLLSCYQPIHKYPTGKGDKHSMQSIREFQRGKHPHPHANTQKNSGADPSKEFIRFNETHGTSGTAKGKQR